MTPRRNALIVVVGMRNLISALRFKWRKEGSAEKKKESEKLFRGVNKPSIYSTYYFHVIACNGDLKTNKKIVCHRFKRSIYSVALTEDKVTVAQFGNRKLQDHHKYTVCLYYL